LGGPRILQIDSNDIGRDRESCHCCFLGDRDFSDCAAGAAPIQGAAAGVEDATAGGVRRRRRGCIVDIDYTNASTVGSCRRREERDVIQSAGGVEPGAILRIDYERRECTIDMKILID
jgi:hypothetical protein